MCVTLDFKASPPPPQPPAIDNISISSKDFNISWKGAVRMGSQRAMHQQPSIHLPSYTSGLICSLSYVLHFFPSFPRVMQQQPAAASPPPVPAEAAGGTSPCSNPRAAPA